MYLHRTQAASVVSESLATKVGTVLSCTRERWGLGRGLFLGGLCSFSKEEPLPPFPLHPHTAPLRPSASLMASPTS